ncbi:PDZ domain (Also known as DHR or GLGF) [Nesidiocoris tenuis]|uniref:PDZ domain (Also known as DHR or GLGF) n=1 Tax=Nesidiocoris tenuis TaxID=355587 RepID=A0ABN7B5M9_9HEMI|nr:PDZ domain (Also known as DHR or GLGF) [Nesidiocoris tenuis]
MCEELRLERYDKSPWGFRLTGGLDFGAPLTVVKVTGGSIAELGGVQVGDIVVEISGQSTKNMTHTDAQNVIGQAQRSLNIIVMRGSLVTPPDVTPLRGMTPMTELDGLRHSQSSLNSELLNERLENLKTAPGREDGMKCPPIVHENGGLTATEVTGRVMHPTPLPGHESNMTVDTNMSEMELDELLTGNEEVLDQGVLGINFKKFMPQVDFIRQSEVFKFLQNQNTHKELPEDVQLEKEPTKRFSTFLQKPRAPPRKPGGPLWIHPKPPRYLPKDERKEAELPKLRPKQPKVDPGHSVLWLFLDETGEDVEDERWGTAEEERLNLSRNEFIEYDRSSVASMKSRSESSYSNIDNAQLREESCSRASENEESSAEDKKATKFVAKCTIEEVAEIEDEPTQEASRCRERTPEPSKEKDQEQQRENIKNSGNGRIVSVETKETTNVTEKLMKQIQTQQTVESCKLKSRRDEEEEKFSKQLADIKAQIASLEDQAPSDLQTQLLTIHDQLEKIVKLKLMQSAQYKEEKEHYKEAVDEVEEEEEVDEELEDEEVEEEIKIEETITEKQIIEERTEEKLTETTETRVVLVDENGEEVDGEYEDQEEEENGEDSVDGVKKFKKGEYELCEAAPPKKSRGPITPLARPIVLPGGRQWRQPKDAACEEFYTGVLVAQADVLIGSDDGGVNFTKYVPPKFDMSHSAVYRLIHEIEDKTRKKEPLEEHYQTPIGKRHFYAAKLKPPPPIGEVELKDL